MNAVKYKSVPPVIKEYHGLLVTLKGNSRLAPTDAPATSCQLFHSSLTNYGDPLKMGWFPVYQSPQMTAHVVNTTQVLRISVVCYIMYQPLFYSQNGSSSSRKPTQSPKAPHLLLLNDRQHYANSQQTQSCVSTVGTNIEQTHCTRTSKRFLFQKLPKD